MTRKLVITVTALTILLPLTLSCATPELEPTTTAEPPIPTHYSTYTSEGLFSISYPQDWQPATSLIEQLTEWTEEWLQSVDPAAEIPEGLAFLFVGGIPSEEGYMPSVNVVIQPRAAGYWALDEIVEAEHQWCMMYLQDYREYSRTETIVDGRESVIIDCEFYDPSLGMFRDLCLFTVKDEFAWSVTCSCYNENFQEYEDDLNSIVRSFRILK
ncbi:hypothetical protein ES708_31868 [subsurface metagenome]